MNPQLKTLSRLYLTRFTDLIGRLLIIEAQKYDLIIGAGNSGLAVAQFTKIIYNKLKITPPPVLELPIMRFINEDNSKPFNNSVLYPLISKTLQNKHINLKNILFVDDEIRYGSTVKNTLSLIMYYITHNNIENRIKCTVVADEFGGFNSQTNYKNLEIDFRPFIKHNSRYKNIILFNIPDEIFSKLKPFLKKHDLDERSAINLLFDLPVKEKKGIIDLPVFTYKYNQKISSEVPGFELMKNQSVSYISSIIESELNVKNYIK